MVSGNFSMGDYVRVFVGIALSGALALHGYRKRSLALSGCTAAFVVGFVHFAVSLQFGLILIFFYYTSSYLTKLKQERKQRLEAHYKVGGQRDALQVLANSVLASIIAVLYFVNHSREVNVSKTI
jgi:uncharacterized membrane protein